MAATPPIRETMLQILAPAMEAVRTVLSRRDADDVPHRLRRVVRSSARRLPPPLATTLLAHLEDDETLRLEAAELVEGPPAALAYLERHDGWWEVVATGVLDHVQRRLTADHAAVERALSDAHAEIGETKRRLASARDEIEASTAELGRIREEHAERLAGVRARDVERIDTLEVSLARVEGELAAMRSERDRLRADLESLRKRAGRVRAEARAPRPGVDLGRDPAQVARTLDLQLAMWRRRSRTDDATVGAAAPAAPVTLDAPPGLRATDAGWFAWLGTTETPYWLIVDGHNVVFSMTDDRASMADSMRRLEAALRRLAHVARGRARITLVYDSALEGERDPARSERGFVVEFAPADVTADDEIVALAHSADVYEEAIVVVTSDRGLQGRLGDGVVVIASEALAEHTGAA